MKLTACAGIVEMMKENPHLPAVKEGALYILQREFLGWLTAFLTLVVERCLDVLSCHISTTALLI